MKNKKFIVGTSVIVTLRDGKELHGKIVSVDTNLGTLDERELKARRRFWSKKGFFGEPTKKAIERDSMRMQKLVKAMQGYTAEDIRRINKTPYYMRRNNRNNNYIMIATARPSDIEHAILTFKIR